MCAKTTVQKSPKSATSGQKTVVPKSISNGGQKKVKKAVQKRLWVVKLKCIPFGFFEKELFGYFRQFGTVIRVRVARSRKTGNHKGWAYVGFDDKDVAEIAAETMNGYLMFDHRLLAHVMTPTSIPKSMLSGPCLVPRPSMRGIAKRDAKERNNATSANDKKTQKIRKYTLNKGLRNLKNIGVDYDFTPYATKSVDDDVQIVAKPTTPAKVATPKAPTPAKAVTPKQVTPKVSVPETKTPKRGPAAQIIDAAAQKTPAFSPKTRAGKKAAATPATTSVVSKAIMNAVAASARAPPAALEKSVARNKKNKKKSL